MIGSLIASIGQRYLNVTFRSGALRVRIIERPGLWMDATQMGQLTQDLRSVAQTSLTEGDLTYGVFSGRRERMENTVITIVYGSDGRPIAFNALVIMNVATRPNPTEVLHLGLVMVDPAERSKKLSWVLYGLTCFLIFSRRQFRPLWVSNVTQVPAVVGMVSQMFSDVYPQPDTTRRSLRHLQIARRIMQDHRTVFGVGADADFDQQRFVITNAYTGGSDTLKKPWERAAKHRDDRYNTYCADHLDYDRGDDLLQIGRMDMTALRQYLTREVPPTALAGVLMLGGLVALRRWILPVLQWSNSQVAWSILRPMQGRKTQRKVQK